MEMMAAFAYGMIAASILWAVSIAYVSANLRMAYERKREEERRHRGRRG